MSDPQRQVTPDLIEQIPGPETVRAWLADSIRRSELLRSLLRVAIRKAAFQQLAPPQEKEVAHGR